MTKGNDGIGRECVRSMQLRHIDIASVEHLCVILRLSHLQPFWRQSEKHLWNDRLAL